MKTAEYTIKEMKDLVESMSGMYDIVRVVDPIECRVLDMKDDEGLVLNEKCYSVWNGEQRCMNCSSAAACRTGCHQEKEEHYSEKLFNIHSNPVKLRLADGGVHNAVVELVSIQDDTEDNDQNETDRPVHGVRNRESEDTDGNAIRYQANYDSLTRTLREDVFYEKARELLMLDPAGRWMMIIGDIREFRMINSLFGMEKGNEVLVKTAEHLTDIAEKSGGICCRLRGDKFAVLIHSGDYREDDLRAIVEEMNAAFSSGVYKLFMKFGVFEITDIMIPVSVMCDRANMAAKTIRDDLRRTVAYFDDDLMQLSIAEHEIISGFEAALREGQFKMFLQPLTDKDGVPFGAEALVRWIRPGGTVIAPAAFIGTLERAGLIFELDKYIWEQAVKRLAVWNGTDKKDLVISVNMSARDFYKMNVYEILTDLTDKYGVDTSKLRLEITETALIENPDSSNAVLNELRDAGFIIEIDDFGKGHSSLSLLKEIRADILKIDRGFLLETEDTSRSRIILRSVISMAKKLGMQVIAEGVETKKQLDALTDMNCSCFQGFYFSKPLPVNEFEEKYFDQHQEK